MKFRDIMEKVKAKEISLDDRGHRLSSRTRDRLIAQYDRMVAFAGGAHDGKWTLHDREDGATTDARMRKHFARKLDKDSDEDDGVLFQCDDGEYCDGCGRTLRWVLDGRQLTLRHYFDGDDFQMYPPEFRCRFAVPRPTRGRIKVAGTLIFANIFRHVEDCPPEEKYKQPWSLNHHLGRENITRYRAGQNVAYGQMGNMSIGVFVHPDKKSIIVGDKYVADRRMEEMTEGEADKADYEALSVIDGHRLVGGVSLEVWRWEATDLNTLGESRYRKMKKEKNIVEVAVPHGEWEFIHYYDTETSPDENVYARLTLKE